MNKSILTKREKEVFSLLIANKTTREIATSLSISEKTVRNHISNVMQKLGVKGRAQAVVELIRLNEIKLWPLCGFFFTINLIFCIIIMRGWYNDIKSFIISNTYFN